MLGGALAAPYVRRAHAPRSRCSTSTTGPTTSARRRSPTSRPRTGIRVNYDVYCLDRGDAGEDARRHDRLRRGQRRRHRHAALHRAEAADAARPRQARRAGTNLDPEILRIFDTWDPGNAYGVPYMWGSVGIAYNMDMVRERLPDADLASLDVLMKPENAEKLADCGISMLDSPQDIIPMVLAYLGKDGRAANPADYPAAVEALQPVPPVLRHLRQRQLHQRAAERRALRRGELVGRLRHRHRPRRGGRRRDRPRVLRARDRRPGLGRLHVDPGRRAAPGERPRLPRLPAASRR